MATTIVTLTGDEASLLRAFQKIQAAQEKTDQGFKKTKDTANDAASQIGRDMESAGKSTTEAFNASIRELRKMGPEGRAAAAEVEKHLRETGQAGRVSFAGVVGELAKLDEEAAKVANNAKKSFEDAGQAKSKVFGADAIAEVKSFATQWLAVGSAIGLITSGLQTMRAEQTAALDSLMTQADPERRLAQVATSAADLDAMIAKADELSQTYGISRDQARGLMFSARSEGFEGDIDMIARASQVVDVTSQASLAGVLGRQFGGEGGSTDQRLSAVLAAAEKSAFNFETVGANVIKSASATRAAGSDMSETLATNAVMANLIGDTAGDRVKAFAALASLNPMLQGKGVMGAVGAIEQMPDDLRAKVLGQGQEVNEAYRLLLENRDSITEMTSAIRQDVIATAEGGGVLAGKIAIVEDSERFQARRDVNRAAAAREIAAEQSFGQDEAAFQAGQDNVRAGLTAAGGSQLFGVLGEWAGSGARLLGADAGEANSVTSMVGRQRLSPWMTENMDVDAFQRNLAAQRAAAAGTPELTEQFLEELRGIRRNTSQAPVISGTALQSPVAAAAAP